MQFGDHLRMLREKQGLYQRELANMLQVDRSMVSKWESGTRLPDARMLIRLSECLHVEVQEILEPLMNENTGSV